MGYTSIDYSEMSDRAIISLVGQFIKQQRLEKEMTQAKVAEAAGVNRWTISKIENRESITLTSLIQILRALELLDIFEKFQYKRKLSPIEMVKIESKNKKRVRGKNYSNTKKVNGK